MLRYCSAPNCKARLSEMIDNAAGFLDEIRAELRRYRPQQAQEFRKNLSRARQGACCNLVVSGKAPTLAKDYVRTWDTTAR